MTEVIIQFNEATRTYILIFKKDNVETFTTLSQMEAYIMLNNQIKYERV